MSHSVQILRQKLGEKSTLRVRFRDRSTGMSHSVYGNIQLHLFKAYVAHVSKTQIGV